ncbi:hypothetical protein THASP1DRAFT_21575 [Thamnocephalis sphaerospora]|uniref:NADAR domain-containing protein n=1 Tax=Thamnocephalis sphaerospora TaxID=78915 RepID=A0A4P9XWR4_9FUNG|nr:hypothetical protein THASP1DRAFT_21575 [Thamnocephalis sphaerospora]|eukprot:RKP10756.1 hypothetical protein THASP1DRAFT_21575 [Thamnocephalis sphaerospora]
MPPLSECVRFYHKHQPFYEFTNFYHAPFWLDGILWPTSEHFFQASKFWNRDVFSRIKRLDWEEVKEAIMRRALIAKFQTHSILRHKLLATCNARLVEHTYNDRYWGDGGDGTGRNRLGKLLLDVRQKLASDMDLCKL